LEVTKLKNIIFLSLSLLALLIIIPGCFTFQTPPAATVPPVGQPSVIGTFNNNPSTIYPGGAASVIGTFSSNPSTISAGGTSTLIWNVTGASSVSIDQGIGQVDAAGTRLVSPAASTVYTISATNAAGTVTRSAVTMVNPASLSDETIYKYESPVFLVPSPNR
jgi:hypothetical protein